MFILILYALFCRLLLLLAVLGFVGAAGLLAWRTPGLAILVGVFLAWRRLRGWQGSSGAYGTARIMTADELYDSRLVGGRDGVMLGRAASATGPLGGPHCGSWCRHRHSGRMWPFAGSSPHMRAGGSSPASSALPIMCICAHSRRPGVAKESACWCRIY